MTVVRGLGASRKGCGGGSGSGRGSREVGEREDDEHHLPRRETSGVRWTSATERYSGFTHDRE